MSEEINVNASENDASSLVESNDIMETASENYIDALIEENNLQVNLLLNTLEVSLPGSLGSNVLITLNGTQTTTPAFYAPLGGGTYGQILYAGGNGVAPYWGALPTITTVRYSASITTGSLIGTLTIGNNNYGLYYTPCEGTTYTAGTGLSLSTTSNAFYVNFVTSITTDTDKAPTSYAVYTAISAIQSTLSSYATQTWVTENALSGYATESYVTTLLTGYVENSEITDMATKTWVNGTALTTYASISYVSTVLTGYSTINHTHSQYITDDSYTVGSYYIREKTQSTEDPSWQALTKGMITGLIGSTTYASYDHTHSNMVTFETLGTILSNYAGPGITVTSGAGGWTEMSISLSVGTALSLSTASGDKKLYVSLGTASTQAAAGNHTHSQYITDISGFNLTSFNYALPVTGYSDGNYILTRTGSTSGNPGHTWNILSSSMVTTALGYTPYNSTNPSGYITGIDSSMVTTALGYQPLQPSDLDGYATQSWVTSALSSYSTTGHTHSQYITDISGFNLTSFNYALPVTGYSDGNYILTRTGSTSGNPGHTWNILSSSMVTTALGYTPYNSTNPSGYITGIDSSMVTTALGYQPLQPSDLDGYATQSWVTSALSSYSTTGHTHSSYATKASPTFTGVVTINTSSSSYYLKLNRIRVPSSSGGTNYTSGSSGYIIKSNGSTVYWAPDNTASCLAEGTLIAMADGTEKPIEEIKIGDEVVGYDPINKCNITTKVIDMRFEGETKDQLHEVTFDDGSCLITALGHDIFNIEDSRPINIEQWNDGMKAKTKDGNEIVLFSNLGGLYTPESIKYYNIDTDCATYYANGILVGCNEKEEIVNFYKNHIPVAGEDEELAELVETFKELYSQHTFRVKNTPEVKEFRKQIIESYKKGTQAISEMNKAKEELASLDYKDIKRMEGLITDEEWAELIEQKEALRNTVNTKKTESEYWRAKEAEIRAQYEVTLGCGNDRERYEKAFTLMQEHKVKLNEYAQKIINSEESEREEN